MENLIETLKMKKQVGYGHFYISIELNGEELRCTTTNALAIDVAFDEFYDEQDNKGRIYESQKEAQQSLVDEILFQ